MQNHVLFMHWVSEVRGVRSLGVDEEHTVCYCSARTHTFFSPRNLSHPLSSLRLSPLLPLLFVKDLVLLLFISQSESLIIVERCYTVSSFSALGLKLMWNKSLFKPKSVFPFLSFQVCLSNALGPWGLRRSEPSSGAHGTPCYPACTAAAAVHAGLAAWRRGR